MSDTVIQTAEALAPTLLSVAAAASPQAASVAALAPVAIQLLQLAMQLQSAGAMSQSQLAGLFSQIGQGVQQTHNAWVAMNPTLPQA